MENIKNGTVEKLQLGDVVEISGATTKCDNGLYFVEQVPGRGTWSGAQYCLKKIGKTGKIIKSGSTIGWWPMRDQAARLSRPEGVPLEGVAEWFRETAAQMAEQIESETRRGWTVNDAERARLEAEKAARIEEREKYLQQRSAGREYIETAQAAHPVQDAAPVVEIPFSELPAFHAWTESKDRTAVTIKTDGHGKTISREEKVIEPRRRLLLSVAAADEILKHFDGEVGTDAGYYKTDFIITWTGDDGEENTYSGRYDIGDGDGGLVEHVRSLGRWDLEHAQTDEAREAAQARIDTAEMLARYLPGGEIVKVEFAPWVLSALAAKKKKEEEARERFADTLAAVEMLTDEQLINAVNLAPYADPEKRDVGRFFLQQLAGRDEKKALEVFRRWVKGEEAPLE